MTYAIRKSGGGSAASGGTSVPGGGTVYQFPQYIADGSAAAPELAFVNDNTKGFFATASGLGVATGGIQRLFVGNDGNVSMSGGLNVAGAVALSGLITLAAGSTISNITAANPNGVVTAPPASVVLSTTGGTNASLWVKQQGFGDTGWESVSRPTVVASCTSGLPVGTCVSITETAPGSFVATQVDVATLGASPAAGVVTSVTGTSCVVALSGVAEGVASGLTAGKRIFVGPGGVLTTNPASLSAPYFVQEVGMALSTTGALLAIQTPSLYRAA